MDFRNLKLATVLAAAVGAQTLAVNADELASCSVSEVRLSVTMHEGDYQGQSIRIDLRNNGVRSVMIGEHGYDLKKSERPGSIIESAGDINVSAVELNDQRGKDNMSHAFFISAQQPWSMLQIGISSPDRIESVTVGTSQKDGPYIKETIACTGNAGSLILASN